MNYKYPTKEQIELALSNGLITASEAEEAERYRVKITEAKRKEELKKKAAQPKPKYYYDVKVECMLPATLIYRVHAETPEQASEMVKHLTPTGVKHRLNGRKNLKLTVYDAGGSMIRFVKSLFGG